MRTVIVALVIAVGLLTEANAQGRQAGPPPPATPAPPPREQPTNPPPPPPAAVNVRIDVAVIDEGGPQTLRESVSLTTTDRQESSSRSEAAQVSDSVTILNVDATPQVSGLPTGRIRLRVSLDYLPKPIENQPPGSRTRTRLQFAVILDDGKSMVVSNISDPATDRRVRVEVAATILK